MLSTFVATFLSHCLYQPSKTRIFPRTISWKHLWEVLSTAEELLRVLNAFHVCLLAQSGSPHHSNLIESSLRLMYVTNRFSSHKSLHHPWGMCSSCSTSLWKALFKNIDVIYTSSNLLKTYLFKLSAVCKKLSIKGLNKVRSVCFHSAHGHLKLFFNLDASPGSSQNFGADPHCSCPHTTWLC